MRNILILSLLILTTTLSSGCVYRSGIIQGGQVDDRAIKRVEVGMTRDQVRRLLGTPAINNPYHIDRWDYVFYTLNTANSRTPERVSIFFDKGSVSKIENTKPVKQETAEIQ